MLLLLLACQSPPAPAPTPKPSEAQVRAEEAQARLAASPGGQVLAKALEAHGGLEAWYAAETLDFEFDYAPVGAPEKRKHTRSRVELRSARVVQEELGEGADARFGWDGARAWVTPSPEALNVDARFWALTPYYFVGVPFVLADPGARWEDLGELEVAGEAVRAVKVSYEPGTGDSPDDYYVLHLDPETWQVEALRYIVSYPGFFPEGGTSPEKLMAYTDFVEQGGLRLVSATETHAWSPETLEPGETTVRTTIRYGALGAPLGDADFAPPEGAVLLDTP
ncbi:MAG: hypothetical protein H6741_21645 [Alphaproteobacteria bacterium]|nr:hypothetical protein [Alphaproteobacteria bacterium]MCB9795316.1 hypothetical protein [Alphaproteobacteria bacterium]